MPIEELLAEDGIIRTNGAITDHRIIDNIFTLVYKKKLKGQLQVQSKFIINE